MLDSLPWRGSQTPDGKAEGIEVCERSPLELAISHANFTLFDPRGGSNKSPGD